MKIMDFFMQMSFRKDEEGNEVFFPWGIFGKGRVMDNSAKKDEIRKFLRSYYLGMLLVFLLLIFFIQPYLILKDLFWVDILFALGIIIISFVWLYFGVKPIISNLPESTLKMKVRDNLKIESKFLHPIIIIVLGLASLMFVVSGFCMLAAGQTMIGLAAIIFFGLCAGVYGYMLYLRFTNKETEDKSTDSH